MKILPIIINFNTPETADSLFEKLSSDGFEEIILADNGSDQAPPAINTNFSVPKNIFFVGICRQALDYCLQKKNHYDFYWLITTSAEFLPKINYKINLIHDLEHLTAHGFNVGIFSPSIIGNVREEIKYQCFDYEEYKEDYIFVPYMETIAALFNKNLIKICKKKQAGFYEKNFIRGWGTDWESAYVSIANNFCNVITRKNSIIWRTNLGYLDNKRTESLDEYRIIASKELKETMSLKYGRNFKAFIAVKYYGWIRKNKSLIKKINATDVKKFCKKNNSWYANPEKFFIQAWSKVKNKLNKLW